MPLPAITTFCVAPAANGAPGASRPFPAHLVAQLHECRDEPDCDESGCAGTGDGAASSSQAAGAEGTPGDSDAGWRHTWPRLFQPRPGGWGACAPCEVAAVAVPGPIWCDVDQRANEAQGCALTQLHGLPAYDVCFQGF
jgi:hypothetical protein